jgi:hypothetical protein
MAEINVLILNKLDTILNVLLDIRIGVAEALEENLTQVGVVENQPDAKGV